MNTAYKILYNHHLLPHFERLGLVPDEHFGNHKRIQAMHCVGMKVLSMETMCVTREVEVLKVNGATGCHDCIFKTKLVHCESIGRDSLDSSLHKLLDYA